MTHEIAVRPGVTLTPDGAGFTLFSRHASCVELVLLSANGATQDVIPLERHNGPLWHSWIPGLQAGQLYGYRVHGPNDPARGQLFNPAKLLLDPYARAIGRPLQWNVALHGLRAGPDHGSGRMNKSDSAEFAPLGQLIDADFDWQGVQRPLIPASDTVIYETHVKGFTHLHPDVPPELRGTYLGVSSPAAVRHLLDLGVTSVQLLPVHAYVNDERLVDQGLSQYWGYNTLAFFAPEPAYATSGGGARAVAEFKMMVRELHRAGLEVILDVVYNHTGEGNRQGPTLGFRGIDNSSYYWLRRKQPENYVDYTGTGNTLNLGEPFVLQLLLDSLRYWVQEMGVDGFRFDLAVVLGRQNGSFDAAAAFFQAVQQDPLLANVKLYAEPWDLGAQGYQAGAFSWRWAEWNGQYRDCARRFWQGQGGMRAELATRLSGSSDLYAHNGRNPQASVNFVTAHDGFTLLDLVSYERKHNTANQEGNRDGSDNNLSQNFGVEGPSSDPEVLRQRDRLRRALLATLLVSQGTPMLLGGDELGRTQRGNNNAYCQDNDVSWFDWKLDTRDTEFLEFTRMLLRFRRSEPALRLSSWLTGERRKDGNADVVWWHADGREMTDDDWNGNETAFGMLLAPAIPAGRTDAPRPADSQEATAAMPLLIVIHGFKEQDFTLPPLSSPGQGGAADQGFWQLRWSSGASPGSAAADPPGITDRTALSGLFAPGAIVRLEGLAITAFSGSAGEPQLR